MGLKAEEIYGASRKFTENAVRGLTVVEGKPCKIQDITPITGGNRVTFLWTADDGTTRTSIMNVMDGAKGETGEQGEQGIQGETGEQGVSVAAITQVPGEAQIVVEFSDGTQSDPIDIPTEKGDPGDTPTVEVGTTETVEYPADAEVIPVVTSTGIKLNFKIPRGRAGEGGGASTVEELEDVELVDLRNGQILVYNASRQRWENGDSSADINRLGDIEDVDLNNLKDGQVIVWDATNLKWVNADSANPIQFASMPAATDHPNEVIQFIGATTTDYKRGYFYRSTPVVVSGELTYVWQQLDTQPSNSNYEDMQNKPQINGVELLGNKSTSDLDLQNTTQFRVMPAADATRQGQIIQYTGATTSDYKKGYFYQCIYQNDEYAWTEWEVSDNAALQTLVEGLRTDVGDLSNLEVAGVVNLVAAINKVNAKEVDRFEYIEPNLIIHYHDASTKQLSVGDILAQTQIGELANVVDDTIADGNILQYDSAIQRYKPYAILTVLTNLLQDSKDYTDQKIGEAIVAGAYVCDEKPEYDADNDTVIYKQNGVTKTTTQTDARFYYHIGQDAFCTSWIDDIEFTFSVADVDFDDYVNKTDDVVSTYTEDMLNKSKIPDIAALDALLAIVKDALALKVNTADIIDVLTSSDATKPLSAKQGKVLKDLVDTKNDKLQFSNMPVGDSDWLGKVAQFVGTTSGAYTKGSFYECRYDNDTSTYYWDLIKYSTDIDDHLDDTSHNPVENAVLTPELEKKAEALSTLPEASSENIGKVAQYIGTTTPTLTHGYFYEVKAVAGSSPTEYEWAQIPVQPPVETATQNTLGVVKGGDGTSINANGGIDVVDRLEEVSALPTASAALEGKCYFLKGTQSGYVKGSTYQCQSDGEDPATYSWVPISGADVSQKADKVTNATEGNLAGLDANGNLTDSGISKELFNHNIPRLRPKDITSYYSDGTLWKRLNGTDGFELFEDIFTGDYIHMSRAISAYERTGQYQETGSEYVTIGGIDTLMGNGDTAIDYHHLVMIPGKGFGGTQHFGRSRMNSSNATTGGYVGSEMHTTTIGAVTSTGSTAATATINQQLYAEFGAHLKTTRELLSNSINATGYNKFGTNSGCSNNWAWTSCQAVLMSEVECYGAAICSSSLYDTGNAAAQLPLFTYSKEARNNRSSYYWLKDVASATNFCRCYGIGNANSSTAGRADLYVRPRFVIAA